MPSGSMRRSVATGLFVTVLWALHGALAARPQDPAQQRPTFRVGSSFVRVDAYPVKDGKPVMDLTADEFEILEDGVPQKVESFEHVVVRAPAPTERVEVPSQRESLQAAANPRNRVFVVFLDTFYVGFSSTHSIKEPLINLLNRILGPDDLVGFMTPDMAASEVVLGRKTDVIERALRDNPFWGKRSWTAERDETEQGYAHCFPPQANESGVESRLALNMIMRKRERATLEAMQDLVRYLRSIREERKAILMVTEGWVLFREDRSLLDLRTDANGNPTDPVPGKPPIRVGPTGKLTTDDPRDRPFSGMSQTKCDTDRLHLASIDDQKFFRDIMDDANAGNATFYPINPRGLDVFDEPMAASAAQQKGLYADMMALRTRNDVLRTLADNTDGRAVVDANDLEGGLRRISDDLSSYYLLGYSSTNTTTDGGYRTLKVRVKRPGVNVRARRGYRAASAAEIAAARRAADAPIPDATRTVTAAISRLGSPRGDLPFRINAATAVGSAPGLWVAGELVPQPGRPDDFAKGGTAVVDATIGAASFSAEVTLKPGERTFVTSVPISGGVTGEISIKARITPAGGGLPYTDMLRMTAPSPSEPGQPLFFKRGLTTGNRWVPVGDLRLSRTERVRLEWPVGADIRPGAGRVLDRAGQPLQVPVTVTERIDDATHQRWITAELALAPLSNADYAVEMELVGGQTTQKVVAAIRVVR
jgi:VWFA-related protein